MNTTLDYLDAVKARHLVDSDYKLAKLMGVTRSCVSNYRNGKSSLDDETALRVAELLEMDAGMVVSAAHAERAKRPEEKAMWQSIMQRLGGAAACALLGVALVSPSPSEASFSAPESRSDHYVKRVPYDVPGMC